MQDLYYSKNWELKAKKTQPRRFLFRKLAGCSKNDIATNHSHYVRRYFPHGEAFFAQSRAGVITEVC